MSFAAGIGAGIACGIGCGIAAGEIRIIDREGRPAPLDAVLGYAVAARRADRRRTLLGILLLAGVAAPGMVTFLLLRG